MRDGSLVVGMLNAACAEIAALLTVLIVLGVL